MSELAIDRPAISSTVPRRGALRQRGLVAVCGGMILAFLFIAVAPQLLARYDPNEIYVGAALAPPSGAHWLGTDEVGRDFFSRLVYGARYSLGMALAVVAIGVVVGVALGAISGWVGGFLDEVLMRLVDLFLALPAFVLAMALAASIGRGVGAVIIALGALGWPTYARQVRGMVISIKLRLHVESARSMGAGPVYILWHHILPFTAGQLNARVTQDTGYALVSVAGLNFLGLGVQPPTPEWGALLNSGRNYILTAWWYSLVPGLVIMVWTVAVSLLGDAISESRFSMTEQGE